MENQGNIEEDVNVRVKVANGSWESIINDYNKTINAGESFEGTESWTPRIAPGNYAIVVNASVPADEHPANNERSREVILEMPEIDLYISEININPACNEVVNKAFSNESNEIQAIIWNSGTDDAGRFNVSFMINDEVINKSLEGELSAGSNVTVCILWTPVQPGTYQLNVTADLDNDLFETNESNNVMLKNFAVYNNGYKGKRYTGGEDITTKKTFELKGNLLYSVGDSYYLSAWSYPNWTTYMVNWSASDLPVPLDGKDNQLCRAICHWGIQLVGGLVARNKGEKTVGYLGELPAPCRGGWYRLNETSFGPGWPDTCGAELLNYLEAAASPETREAAKQLLLPPEDNHWGQNFQEKIDLFKQTGVFDGIRIVDVVIDYQHAAFSVPGYGYDSGIRLPKESPPTLKKDFWESYTALVYEKLQPTFAGTFNYEIKNLFIIPGMNHHSKLEWNIRISFTKLLLKSIPQWKVNWLDIEILKDYGQTDTLSYKSPLSYWLEEICWLIDPDGQNPRAFRPRDRWFISPVMMAGRAHHFKHLHPLPTEIAQILDNNDELAEILENLGMPCYQPENPTSSTRLLDDLAKAWENIEIKPHRDIFLGQVRAAWSDFHPETESPFPRKLIVRKGSELKVLEPSSNTPVFLPDETTSFHHFLETQLKNILVIESKDAKRLSGGFEKAFGDGVCFFSNLELQLFVDDAPWTGKSAGGLFCESDIAWVITILLCCHAYAGNQARGAHTKAFSKAVDALRKTEIYWAKSLKIGVRDGDQHEISPIDRDSVWHPKTFTLIARQDAREKISLLSESFARILDRIDLEVSLKLILSKFDGGGTPDHEELAEALNELKIDPEHLSEIEQLWVGDLSWKIRLLRPVLLTLHPNIDLPSLLDTTTEKDLHELLTNIDLSPLTQPAILSLLEKSGDFFKLGFSLYENFGNRFQLDKWNQALQKAGEVPIRNQQVEEQFQHQLDCAQVPLKSIVRGLLRHPGQQKTYSETVLSG